jgi:hypothetical protein
MCALSSLRHDAIEHAAVGEMFLLPLLQAAEILGAHRGSHIASAHVSAAR